MITDIHRHMKNFLRTLTAVFVVSFLLISCSGNQEKSTQEAESDSLKAAMDTAAYNDFADFKFTFTIANLPSPLDIINTVYTTQVPFDNTLLNPTTNYEKYFTSYKKSVNYGVYGVDMAYIAYYGNKQDLYDYYSTARRLAESIGTQETFDRFTDRFEENADNRDSVMAIVDQAYTETDKFLRSNSRLLVASQVVAGAFLESLFISTTLLKDQEPEEKYKASFTKIYEQKLVLNNLIDLFKEFKDKESTALQNDLQTLKVVFDTYKDASEINKASLQKISAAVATARNNAIR